MYFRLCAGIRYTGTTEIRVSQDIGVRVPTKAPMKKLRFGLQTIAVVDAVDFPDDVERYIEDELHYPTHYQSDIIQVEDDGNVFSEWLKDIGYEFPESGSGSIAMWAT